MPSYIVRDPRFSMSMTDSDAAPGAARYPRVSFAKQLERRIISVWKIVTMAARKQPRNSFMSPDFVVITSRRRSTLPSHRHHFQ
ncbi:hypothetical protein B0H34DRAFT_796741 [Crassisporium funariophilum]|nr:hypothetical protein B0H34DRAFT_796741 [Crassisporium funariophilum]